jgi:hypothetical protein
LFWQVNQTNQDISLQIVGGDYNGNGVVDAADYAMWSDTLGSITNLAADGDGNGSIGAGDYHVWRANFGRSSVAGGGTSFAIPEPAAIVLALTSLPMLALQRQIRTRRSITYAPVRPTLRGTA